jgi:CIC family chloride channel protein
VRCSADSRPIAAAAGGLVVGILAMGFPEVAGNGFEAIQGTLDGNLAGPLLLALVLGKGIATIASVSTGSPGGVFTPSMFIGAALGGTIGTIAPSIFPAAGPSGGYALVGMAAMVAATTHAPLMAATLGFELSGDYAIVLPLLLATSIAAFVSRSLRQDSVYTEELRRRGIPWHGSLRQRLASAVRARDILERSVAVVPADAPLDDALRRFDDGARAVYLAGTPARVIGTETARSIWAARARGQAVPSTGGEAGVPVDVATLDDTLLALSEKLWKQEQGQLPVVDAEGEIVGVVTRREVLGAIDREVLDRSALLTRVVRYEGPRASADYLELPVGWLVETVGVPPALVDRVIDFGALREDPGVVVLGVRPRGRGALFDVAGRRLRPGDHLVVVGPSAAIEAFVALTVAA